MLDIEVRNFQSIEHEQVRVEGFTALVGCSNIGKSALIRAVKSALTNALGTDFVRHGPNCTRRAKGAKACKCACAVRIVTDGLDLLWEKGDAVHRYTVNGVVYDKVERGFPPFLAEFGLSPVKIGGDVESIQVSDQFEPIFLLNRSGGDVAELISDVGKLDRINLAIRMVEKDRKEALSTRKIREKDVAELKSKLIPYADLDDDLLAVERVKVGLEQVKNADSKLAQLDRFLESLRTVLLSVQVLTPLVEASLPQIRALLEQSDKARKTRQLADSHAVKEAEAERLAGVDLVRLPSIEGVRSIATRASQVLRFQDSYASKLDEVRRLVEVDRVSVPSSSRLKEVFGQVSKVASYQDLHAQRVQAVESLESVDSLVVPPVSPLHQKHKTFATMDDWYTRAQALKAWFLRNEAASKAVLPEAPSLVPAKDRLALIARLGQRYTSLTQSVNALEEELKHAALEEKAVQQEFKDLGPVCPTCARPYAIAAHLGDPSCHT